MNEDHRYDLESLITDTFYKEHPGCIPTKIVCVYEYIDPDDPEQSQDGVRICHIRSVGTPAWTARGMLMQAADDMYLPD